MDSTAADSARADSIEAKTAKVTAGVTRDSSNGAIAVDDSAARARRALARRDSAQRAMVRDSADRAIERRAAEQSARRDSIRRAAAERASASDSNAGTTRSTPTAQAPRPAPVERPAAQAATRRDDQDLMLLSDSLSKMATPAPVVTPTATGAGSPRTTIAPSPIKIRSGLTRPFGADYHARVVCAECHRGSDSRRLRSHHQLPPCPASLATPSVLREAWSTRTERSGRSAKSSSRSTAARDAHWCSRATYRSGASGTTRRGGTPSPTMSWRDSSTRPEPSRQPSATGRDGGDQLGRVDATHLASHRHPLLARRDVRGGVAIARDREEDRGALVALLHRRGGEHVGDDVVQRVEVVEDRRRLGIVTREGGRDGGRTSASRPARTGRPRTSCAGTARRRAPRSPRASGRRARRAARRRAPSAASGTTRSSR